MPATAKPQTAAKRPTNVSLTIGLIDEAKQYEINISKACEKGLAESIAKARTEKWLAENEQALLSSNDYVEKHGLPLAKYRLF